ncbi:hypothetical protein [Clostridium sp.]|uniref:hypothetical protein n=1 Tax=Clostridium sp. TaxID=1506 RepID=UPI00291405DD|nr:hypothetical protein [Clostridium sp.]MDU4736904.1 hypothetical protein [Clostridium sp.]MDU7364454.1 hypothetical protein [Clostridium sp.]
MSNKLILPNVEEGMLPAVKEIITALNVPREVLASDEEIAYAWSGLPRELNKIPPELRGELLARMCVATSVGLFDGAINYVWNASINNLRKKVKDFGYNVVGQILQKQFEEKDLFDMKDAELLELCLKINLISEEGFYFLDQCRDVRNNFSAAHPNMGLIDDRELIVYISRCAKYALATTINPKGVDISEFMKSVKASRFSEPQKEVWITRLKNTHEAQRDIIFTMLHGIYCDSGSSEQTRLNSIDICTTFKEDFTSNTISELLNRHYEYQAKDKKDKYIASQQFFEKLGLIGYFTEIEKHNIVSKACSRLMSVHQAYDNFYNEPPFAERLFELTKSNEVPESAKEQFVRTVVTCYVGNQWGQCRAALGNYTEMIKNFSPKEIEIMLKLEESNSVVANRIKSHSNCRKQYKEAVKLINEDSIPVSLKVKYLNIIK